MKRKSTNSELEITFLVETVSPKESNKDPTGGEISCSGSKT